MFWSVLSLRSAGERDYHLLALTQSGLIQSRGDSKQSLRPKGWATFLKAGVITASFFAVLFGCSGLWVVALEEGDFGFLTTTAACPADLLVTKLVENGIAF